MRTVILFLAGFVLSGCVLQAAETVPNRISRAKPGEWVLMADVSDNDSGEKTKFTLVSMDADSFTVRREHIGRDGAVVGSEEHDVDLAGYNERMNRLTTRAKEISSEFIVVNDREYPVTVVYVVSETKDDDGNNREFKIWLSEDFPIGGVAKTWSSDVKFPAAELVDFGF